MSVPELNLSHPSRAEESIALREEVALNPSRGKFVPAAHPFFAGVRVEQTNRHTIAHGNRTAIGPPSHHPTFVAGAAALVAEGERRDPFGGLAVKDLDIRHGTSGQSLTCCIVGQMTETAGPRNGPSGYSLAVGQGVPANGAVRMPDGHF